MDRKARSQMLQDSIQSTRDCHEICVDTATYCLRMGGQHAAAGHMQLLLDCAEICSTSEDFMLRDSKMSAQVCAACADVCDSCAAACAQLKGDSQMQACASVCRSCASACRKLVASLTAQTS